MSHGNGRRKTSGSRYGLTEAEKTLDQYLSQYKFRLKEKDSLEYRRREILLQLDPRLTVKPDIGKPKKFLKTEQSTTLLYRLDEIDRRIQKQIAINQKTLLEIINIFDYIPENSIERSIMERKYIDRHSWEKIAMDCYISKSTAIYHWRKSLDVLLSYDRVQKFLTDWKTRKVF